MGDQTKKQNLMFIFVYHFIIPSIIELLSLLLIVPLTVYILRLLVYGFIVQAFRTRKATYERIIEVKETVGFKRSMGSTALGQSHNMVPALEAINKIALHTNKEAPTASLGGWLGFLFLGGHLNKVI